MKKREQEKPSDFATEYSIYYRLINRKDRKVWANEMNQCHFHTQEELQMLQNLQKKAGAEWEVEKCSYYKPVKI